MSWHEIVLWVSVGTAGLAGLVAFLSNLKKLKEYCVECIVKRRRILAMKLQPFLQDNCTAIACMSEIKETLKIIEYELMSTKEVSVKTLGSDLIRNSDFFLEKGYMPQTDKDSLLADYITYYYAGGNGIVFSRVEQALGLPTEYGKERVLVDIEAILAHEKEQYLNKRKVG